LYLAASERRPLVAGYLAETMSALRIPLNQTYEKGNTIIHYLSMWGDEFFEVLRYLVRVRTPDNKLAFDLNSRNHTGKKKKFFFREFLKFLKRKQKMLWAFENRTFCSPRDRHVISGE
jgi:hypothetical protein